MVGILALLLALLALTACGPQAVSPAVEKLLTASALTQVQINANALWAQETATADVLQAQQRATAKGAVSTQSAAQINANALRAQETSTADVLLAQQRATVNAGISTQNAATTATRQTSDERVGGTMTAIAGVMAAETQAVDATAQQHAEQMSQSVVDEQRSATFLWTWGPLLLILTLVGLGLWAFWYWEIRRRTIERRGLERRAPAPANISQRLDELPRPEAPVIIIDQYPLTAPDGQVSGWLEEVKDKLLTSRKDEDGDPDA